MLDSYFYTWLEFIDIGVMYFQHAQKINRLPPENQIAIISKGCWLLVASNQAPTA